MMGTQHQPPGIFGHNRCYLTRHYALIPPECPLPSLIPGIADTYIRVQTTPALGAEFVWMQLDMQPGGGMVKPRTSVEQNFFYVVSGQASLELDGKTHVMEKGGYCYVPSSTELRVFNGGDEPNRVAWIKKPYEQVEGYSEPKAFVSHQDKVEKRLVPTKGRFILDLLPCIEDMSFDFGMNILSFDPGAYFPMVECHVMEHGMLILEGQCIYYLEDKWHEVWTGDYVYMAPFVPQFCYATGWGPTSYLLYKNVNRDFTVRGLRA